MSCTLYCLFPGVNLGEGGELSSRSDSGFCDFFETGNETSDEDKKIEESENTENIVDRIASAKMGAKECDEKCQYISQGHSKMSSPPSGHYQSQFASTLAMFDPNPRVGYIPVCGARGEAGGRRNL